jgi:hypothetical protein
MRNRLSYLVVVSLLASACVVRTAPGARRAEHRDDHRDAAFDAQSPWDKLGERWVQGGADRDVIQVGMKEGRYKRIKVVVEHSAVELFDITVVFGNGEVYSPPTRLVFGQGATSREIDLPGASRHIRRVEFRYGNLAGGGRAQVELWGFGMNRT